MSLLFFLAAVVVAGQASAYPGDLDLKSFTDDHPDGKPAVNKPAEEPAEGKPADQDRKAETLPSGKDFDNEPEVVKPPEENPEQFLCRSTKEYIETLKFLRKTKVILVTETTARMIADKISKSCDGAAERFAKILTLLKTVGLSDQRSMEIALKFSSYPKDVQKNFLEIFTHGFLAEFFDYDYLTAVALALELSKNYKGDAKQVREDFIELTRFCKNDKQLDLPSRLCADFTIRVARLSQYYPKGVRGPFYQLLERFRSDEQFATDLKTALELTYNVLKFGPHAPDNFFKGYDFATSKEGLDLSHAQALEFGMKMASRSFRGEQPPIIPAGFKPSKVLSNASRQR